MYTTRAFLTVEIVLALALFTILMSGVWLVAFGGQTEGLDVSLGKDTLYSAQSSAQTDMQSAAVFSGFSALSTLTNASIGFARTVASVSPCLKTVNDAYSTSTEKSRSLQSGVTTIVASIDAARALGGGCDPFPPPPGWENPDSFGSTDVSGADGTGVDAQWIGGHRYVFVSADPSSVGKEDFYVFTVDDPQNPSLTAQLNTGKGLNGVVVAGNYAYVIQNDSTNQLQVIDLTDPANPSVATQYTLPGVLSTGSFPEGRSIAYYNNRVYIGTKETAGPEFHVFDVTTPSAPIHLGSLEVTHNVNDIAVLGTTAYLATSADYAELTMIEVSNPGALALPPSFIDPAVMNYKFNARTHTVGNPETGESTEDGQAVFVVGTTVYLGRERESSSNKWDFYTLDASTLASVSMLGSLRLGLASNTYVSDMTVQGRYAYLSATDSNEPFFVIDVRVPAVPVIQSSCGYNFSQVTRAVNYLDNFIFTTNRSNDILRILYDKPGTSC